MRVEHTLANAFFPCRRMLQASILTHFFFKSRERVNDSMINLLIGPGGGDEWHQTVVTTCLHCLTHEQ